MTTAGAGQPTDPTAGGAKRPASARPWQIATIVLLIGCGALAYLFFSQRATSEELGETAESSARAACTLVGQVPEEGFDMSAESNFPQSSRLAAAEALAYLAKDQDAEFEALHQSILKPRQTVAAMFTADTPEFVEALSDANDACAEIAD